MKQKDTVDRYQKLANAIIVRAITDFRKALKHLAKGKGNLELDIREINEVISFVKSDWFTTLTKVKSGRVLIKLQEEVDQSGIREIFGNERYEEFITTTFYSEQKD